MNRYIFVFLIALQTQYSAQAEIWNDVSHLNPENVKTVIRVETETDIVNTLKNLSPGGRVVISGSRHSQGGHIVFPDAIVLDMKQFNKIVSISPASKTIVVQSGATWAQVQQAANSHALSVKVMQSSNIFTVGGSLSANAHGRDPQYGPIIETVKSMKMALADGEVVTVSRELRSELFYAAIGGYGLLGVILEAELELTDNLPLIKTTSKTSIEEYPGDIDRNLALHYGRCSFVKGEGFLEGCFITNFYNTDSPKIVSKLEPEKNIKRNARVFSASRKSNLGKRVRWKLQKSLIDVDGEEIAIDRNTAMRPPVEFLSYKSSKDTDILQEYFVPIADFKKFMAQLKTVLVEHDVNLLSVTLRYLKKNDESLLSYSQENMVAVVLYINIELNEASVQKARMWTHKLVGSALSNNGTYYLTYQRFPTLEQFESGYPGWEQFMDVKCKYDPSEVFASLFYKQYLKEAYNKLNLKKELLTGGGCMLSSEAFSYE